MKSSKSFLQEFRQPSTSFLDAGYPEYKSPIQNHQALEEGSYNIHPSCSKPLSPIARICYPFFLSHLHNPYPTLAEKEVLLKESGLQDISLTNVSNWFTNSRRRCGWMDICNEFFKGDTKSMVNACEWVLDQNMSNAAPRPSPTRAAVDAILSMQQKVQNWHKSQTDPSPWVVELCELLDSYSLEDKSLIEIGYQILTGTKSSNFLVPELDEPSSTHSNVNPAPSRLANEKRKADALLDFDDDDRPLNDNLHSYPTTSYKNQTDDFASRISRTPSLSWSNSTDGDEDSDLTRPAKRQRSETSSPGPYPPLPLANPEIPSMQGDISPQTVFGGDMTPTRGSFTFSLPWDLQDLGFLQDYESATISNDQSSGPQSLQKKRTWTDVGFESDASENKTEECTTKRRRLSNVVHSEESIIISLPQFVEVPTSDNLDTHSTQCISQLPLNFTVPEMSNEEFDFISELLQQISEAPPSGCSSLPSSTTEPLPDGTALIPATSESNIEISGQTEFEVFNWENLIGFFCPENEDSALRSDGEIMCTAQIANDFLQLPFPEENAGCNSGVTELHGHVEPEILENASLIQESLTEIPSNTLNDVPESNLFFDELFFYH